MKKQKTLPELTREIVETFRNYTNTGTPVWTYETAVKDLPCQVGSLTKLIMQMKGERFSTKTSDELHREVMDELSDILSLVLFIAHELDIDMYHAWDSMSEFDKQKIEERTRSK